MRQSVSNNWDVIVVGGGPAGIASAIAASRSGARTLLIERNGFLGGEGATGLPIFVFHDLEGHKILGGIPQEFVDYLREIEGSTGHVRIEGSHIYTYTLTDQEMVRYGAMEMVLNSGTKLLLHSFVTGVKVNHEHILTVEVANKSGITVMGSAFFIDSTGDGDIAAAAGAPFEKGRPSDGLMQAMTLMFRLGRVDLEKVGRLWNKGSVKGIKPGEKEASYIRGNGTLGPYEKNALEENLFADKNHMFWFNSMHSGELNINVTRIVGKDATNPLDLTEAEIEGRRHIMRIVRFLKKYVPGFENCYIISVAHKVGVRETRRIRGEYVLTEDDILEGRDFPDSIARCGYPYDLHDPKGGATHFKFIKDRRSYGIPYRILIPVKIDNLLVAGRCASTTHEALASIRVMGACMAMGQAAGTAVGLCLKEKTIPRKLDYVILRKRLQSDNVIL